MKKYFLLIAGIIIVNLLFAQAPVYLKLADSILNAGNFPTSIKLYNKALKKSSGSEAKYIYFQLGECYRLSHNYSQAKDYYQKALAAGNASSLIDLHLGEIYTLSGDYALAKASLEKYLQFNPNDVIAKIRLESCNLGLKGQKEKPLYEAKLVSSLSSPVSDYGIAYFEKGKVILASTRESNKSDPGSLRGYSDLFESEYVLQKGEWSKPVKLKGSINTDFNEGTFAFDPANKYGYYMQCNGESGKKKNCNILYSYYNEALNTWETAKLFEYNSTTYSTGHPSITRDGKTMYFVSDMPGGYGGKDLYVIKKIGNTWGKPENLGATINTVGDEMFPFISGDTLLVFSSDGQPGFGGLDLFTSSIKNGVFSKPVNMMPPFNSSADDFGLIFKDSKDEGFFCSNRSGGLGDDDIYSYSKIAVILSTSGYVRDKVNNKALSNSTIYIKGSNGSIDSTVTDNKGHFEYAKLNINTNYSIKATRDGYLNDSKSFIIGNELYSKDFNADFSLIKITKEEVKIDNIYYDYDKWDLREESKKELDKLINVLRENPEVKVQLSSHTDVRGAKDYNIELSQKRAQSVVDYLIANGIDINRLIAKGYGFSMPVVKNAKTEEQHQLNRRTTFKILNVEDLGNISNIGTYIPINTYAQSTTPVTTAPVTTAPVTTTPATTAPVTTTPATTAPVTTTPVKTTPVKTNPVKTNPVTTTPVKTTPVKTTPVKTNPVTTNPVTTNPTNVTTVSENKFFIIAGSYKTTQEANAAVNELKAKGFINSQVVDKNSAGSWRICYNSYTTKEDALKDLTRIQLSNKTAWIYTK